MRIVVLLACLLLVSGCNDKIDPGRTAETQAVKLSLPLMTVEPVEFSGAEQLVGTLESTDQAVIAARSSGVITRLEVREGSQVAKGELLALIGDNPSADMLRAAEKAVTGAGEQVAAAEARWTLAQQTATRYEPLMQAQAVTPQEYDQVQAELELARRGLSTARSELERRKAEYASAKKQNSHDRVVAPYAGQVGRLQSWLGATVLPGIPLLTLDRAGARQARIKVPERLQAAIAPGTAIRISVPALAREFSGTVERVQRSSDPNSRSFDSIVALPESEGLPTGLFVRAYLPGSLEELLLIPETAVTVRGQLTGVFVEQQGLLRFRLVRLGRSFDRQKEVLSGLQAGQRIVSANVEQARDGVRVE